MEEKFGITLQKAQPLQAILLPKWLQLRSVFLWECFCFAVFFFNGGVFIMEQSTMPNTVWTYAVI